MRAVGAALVLLAAVGSARAEELGTVDGYRYLAVMTGDCDRFVVADREAPSAAPTSW